MGEGVTPMIAEPTDGSLYEVFREIPDPRHRRGTIYPLASVLTLVSAAMLCGARSLAAISQWGRDYNHLAPPPGSRRPPCAGGRAAGRRSPNGAAIITASPRNSASAVRPAMGPTARPAPANSTPSW